MTKHKRLKLVDAQATKLGAPTIMDRALAQRYGANYVHLAAFAIDVDRLQRAAPEDAKLPFGWEVFLTELRLLRLMDEASTDPTPLLEEMCLLVMDLPSVRGSAQGALGSQFPFAVYTGVAHGHLPARLGQCFIAWKKPPIDLIEDVAGLFARPGLGAQLAEYCLRAPLEPPLVAPVREVLEAIGQSSP